MLTPGFYCVQQMGHVRHYGFAEEVEVAGTKMLAVTLPAVGEPGDWRHQPERHYDPLPAECDLWGWAVSKKKDRVVCPRCGGAGFLCTAYGRGGCECSAVERCELCLGTGKVRAQ